MLETHLKKTKSVSSQPNFPGMNIDVKIYIPKTCTGGEKFVLRQESKKDSCALGGQRRPLISLAGCPSVTSIPGRVRKMVPFR